MKVNFKFDGTQTVIYSCRMQFFPLEGELVHIPEKRIRGYVRRLEWRIGTEIEVTLILDSVL